MKIEAVDFFYLSMPVVTDAGDGSQDALVVRVAAGGMIGWGECEASPLVSIAAYVTPMSHGACKPVRDVVLGQQLETASDIARIGAAVELECMDLLQAAHTFSGIEMALWDLLGRKRQVPVYELLGYARAYPKLPYASQLFGDTPQETLAGCRSAREKGFRAVKCGWGPFGRGSLADDRDHLRAAREGLGDGGTLLIDAGQIFREDVDAAAARIAMLEDVGALWLEEPFHGGAYDAYAALAARGGKVRLAGGEASHNVHMARQLIDYGKVAYVQIDCGRIGGIGPAKLVADFAAARDVTYVNHTFTSHLALCASLQPYAGLKDHVICEYPFAPKSVAWDMSETHLLPNANGEVVLPAAPGLGITMNPGGMAAYVVDVEISVKGKVLYRTPSL
ncbi:mandelate racemase/muconate lactonizing enzyme family protein [Mesorhizobium sp. AR07]|uniref:mandelate racemase/muconate lactonizing enzyme family protein n=1 Tax=Mesorhizobium sp. AR07 TaxID=2865838 RepID=UPI0021604FF2|nr:mandelate racemase/muconate lactonizing enzyme family protein [Mesorhizobium sp. AR07]UVK43870.1 mandelate racemase/muconate lactonizing enzyme family protein [Mesorhizobium sp. AR07]